MHRTTSRFWKCFDALPDAVQRTAKKNKENYQKHKVTFDEGKTVFNDPFLWTFPDPEHSDIEQRYLDIGYSSKGRILVVSHTERGGNIRIISCRKATATERRAYEEGN